MSEQTFEIDLLDPVERPAPVPVELAPRLSSLEGVTIALLENTKTNSAKLLDYIAEVLQHEHGIRDIIRRSKPAPSFPPPDEVYDELAARSHAVITGIGD